MANRFIRPLQRPLSSSSFVISSRLTVVIPMVFFLSPYVVNHPLQIFRTKTDDSISALPVQHTTIRDLVVYVKRTYSFQAADPVTDQNVRRDCRRQMHVIFHPTDCMKMSPLCFANFLFQIMVGPVLNPFDQNSMVVLGVPSDVQIDLTVNVLRHGRN